MRRVIVTVLIAVLVGGGWGGSVLVVEAQASGSTIAGIAVSGRCNADPDDFDAASDAAAEHEPLKNYSLRLRNVETGTTAAMVRTNEIGEFSFTDVNPGTYVIEGLEEAVVMVVSIPITLTEGAPAAGDVPVIVPGNCPRFILFTPLGLVLLAAAAAGIVSGVVIGPAASPSQ